MDIRKSIKRRRIGVIITYLSLFSIVMIFEYCTIKQWSIFFKIIEIASITVFIGSYIITYFKTGLWQFTHKPLDKLDEREITLTSKSLRYAYGIFTVLILILLFLFTIIDIKVNMVLVSSLIFFAHILPASIIAWTEKEV